MVSNRTRLALRWSRRDLREHWVAVVAIALVLAIGTGVYAGLGSTGEWRRLSNDASFAELDMHDVRVSLSPGTFAESGQLDSLVSGIDEADLIVATNERLILGTQVDASTAEETILVPGRVIGLDPAAGPDRLWVDEGQMPGDRQGVLELKFANTYDLPTEGTVELAGGTVLGYRGLGSLPTDFYISGETGDILAQFNFAVLYTDLETAQILADRPGAVNDVVVSLTDGADHDAVAASITAALTAPDGVSATVTTQAENEAFRILYTDIDSDQKFWNVLSGLILVSAALAAFNLISRVVEAQRREIGIGLALGDTPGRLAVRPLLLGLQIAVVGTLLGIVVGLVVSAAMRGLLIELSPMPVWRTPFQLGRYAQAALLGVMVPIVSAALPVWRATLVEPIEAIRVGHLGAKPPSRFVGMAHLPGSSIAKMPIRNLLRTPRRTVLTALGVGAAITVLVAVLGMLDSFSRTVDAGHAEATQGEPDRVTAALDTFYPSDGELAAQLDGLTTIGHADFGLRLPIAVDGSRDEPVEMVVEAIDFSTAQWTPTLTEGVVSGALDELVLSETAAVDLAVDVGDSVLVTHPAPIGPEGFTTTGTTFVVAAVHPNPLRVFAYVDIAATSAMGFDDVTNVAQVYPADGVAMSETQRELFMTPGVASAQPVTRTQEVFDDVLEQFQSFLVITEVAVLALATLIAFNSSRITVHERTREHATMLAFGTPVRTVIATIVKEGVLVGVLATAVGIAAGLLTLRWFVTSLMAETLPDLGITVYVSAVTFLVALAIGVLAMALAPLSMARRMSRMDLPSTLRVME